MRKVKLIGTDRNYAVGKIICLGRNYLDHIRELGGNKVPDRAVIFCKPASSIILMVARFLSQHTAMTAIMNWNWQS